MSLCLCTNEVCKKANKCARFRPEEERWNCYFPLDFVDGKDCKYFVEDKNGRTLGNGSEVVDGGVSGLGRKKQGLHRRGNGVNETIHTNQDGRAVNEGGINV